MAKLNYTHFRERAMSFWCQTQGLWEPLSYQSEFNQFTWELSELIYCYSSVPTPTLSVHNCGTVQFPSMVGLSFIPLKDQKLFDQSLLNHALKTNLVGGGAIKISVLQTVRIWSAASISYGTHAALLHPISGHVPQLWPASWYEGELAWRNSSNTHEWTMSLELVQYFLHRLCTIQLGHYEAFETRARWSSAKMGLRF